MEKLWTIKKIAASPDMNLWDQVLRELELSLPPHEFETWFRASSFLERTEKSVDVRVPNQAYVDTITEKYGSKIREVLDDLDAPRIRIHFLADSLDGDSYRPEATTLAELPTPIFNSRYSFDTFVVGNSNQLAYAASLSIAENPSGSYNPLFIYGGAGLGKTHLIQAIGQQLHRNKTTRRIVYMSADAFVTDLISSIRYDRMSAFRERYRTADALLLDDVQFLAGKERTQEEFFHTFNSLYESQKQIVFTSDAPPRDIPTLEERLRSRFEWGLIADIQPPDLETKVAILRKKAEERSIRIPESVALFIAERVRSNVRELEGLLNRVGAYASLTGHSIDLDLTKEALRDLLAKENRPITANEILKVVSSHYGIKVTELKSKSNARTIAYPRQIAMFLCKALTDLSYPEIGKVFNNKHHSTVIYSVEKIEKLKETDAALANTLDLVQKHFR